MLSFKLKMHQNSFGGRAPPDAYRGSSQSSPNSLSRLSGGTRAVEEEEATGKEGKGGEERKKVRKGGNKEKGQRRGKGDREEGTLP